MRVCMNDSRLAAHDSLTGTTNGETGYFQDIAASDTTSEENYRLEN